MSTNGVIDVDVPLVTSQPAAAELDTGAPSVLSLSDAAAVIAALPRSAFGSPLVTFAGDVPSKPGPLTVMLVSPDVGPDAGVGPVATSSPHPPT
ncbi:hypothetical protein AKJ09_05026 [Labilithrix luteola]|uniref:Uncharacterized protein n=1 Tax=Labilithrix luteola TaxID=1391654 RepID=A0A0K1PXX5_9BACT|nr:hypothetical protein AKJ09_05026 [Labilithrix luteola]